MTDERRDEAYFTEDEVEHSGELTDTELDEGQSEQPTALEGLVDEELREGETDDPVRRNRGRPRLGATDRSTRGGR